MNSTSENKDKIGLKFTRMLKKFKLIEVFTNENLFRMCISIIYGDEAYERIIQTTLAHSLMSFAFSLLLETFITVFLIH